MSKKKNSPAKAPVAAGDVSTKKESTVIAAGLPSGEPDAFAAKLRGKELYILMAAIALGCFIVFRDFLSFEKVYLFKDIGSDTINMYYPLMMHFADYMKMQGIPAWSFSQGMGQNIFPLWLSDVFSTILMFFSKDNIPYAIAWMEVIKIMLCGFVFFKYLSQLRLNKFAAGIGAFLFAFCGYIIVGSSWIIFSEEALFAAIILYGFERWLNSGKWIWFTLGIALISVFQPFLLFLYTIFLAVYACVRYNDVKSDQWNKFPVFILKTLGFAVLGVAITSWQLLPDLLQYIESPRVGGEARLIEKLKGQPVFGLADDWLRFTTTFRAFGSDMLGNGSAFQGWQNYLEAPLFYCGIFCLVTFPQAFTGLNKKQKIAYGILAGIFALPILFPFFRYAFWAYSGDYFRTFSLVITLLLLVFSARGLSTIINTQKLNLVTLGITVAALLFLLYTPADQFAPAVSSGMRSTATLLLFLYAGILYGLSRGGEMRKIAAIALVVLCFGEMVFSASQSLNDRDTVSASELKEKTGYNDYTVDAVSYLKDKDKSFYRINKDYSSGSAIHGSINDAKAQGYFGTMSYHSFNQKNYIKFLGDLGVLDPKDENATRWASGLSGRPLLFAMASGKYALTRQPGMQLRNFGYDSLARFGNVSVFKNRFALPLGFTYDQLIGEAQFKTLSPFQKDVALLRACVVGAEDKDLAGIGTSYNIADTTTPFSLDVYGAYAAARSKDSLNITKFKESHIEGNITLATSKILFFSIPFDEGWHATVNGAAAKLYRVNCGLTGLKLPAGKSNVDLLFVPRYRQAGGIISLVAIAAFIGLAAMSISRNKKKQDEQVGALS